MSLKTQTMRNLKAMAAQQSITMPSEYDKRFKNSWLHILGEDGVDPVKRKDIVLVPKKEKKVINKINWAEISAVINA